MSHKKSIEDINLKINNFLEDMPQAQETGLSKSESANIKINEQFYKDYDREAHPNDLPPTYIYNNTPAIQINKDNE